MIQPDDVRFGPVRVSWRTIADGYEVVGDCDRCGRTTAPQRLYNAPPDVGQDFVAQVGAQHARQALIERGCEHVDSWWRWPPDAEGDRR